jgi:predicted DNA-binding helix-hairpin-helix protein
MHNVSCFSSGNEQKNNQSGGFSNAHSFGICHAWVADRRCISLLKILITNHCVFCVNRASNDMPRASLTSEESQKPPWRFIDAIILMSVFIQRSGHMKSSGKYQKALASSDMRPFLLLHE